ncbi:helix-turn-helix domain-containing protein [Desulfovibrio sp. OttesenSCG-928-M14]|nr:helix-turn-helix domain-containing protein [Desulfovibrio sp. OttesenSCG-928-M14]
MSGNRIIDSMKEAVAIAQGTMPEASYNVHIPETVNVKAIRASLGLSQAGFAARFGLSLHSLRNWEQGKRTPDPAARAYLKVIEKAPDMVTGILAQ